MKPLIGICANYSYDDHIGMQAHLGGRLQQWQLLADDYIKAIEQAGGIPLIIPVYQDIEHSFALLRVIDGVLFSGGNDIDPQHYHQPLQAATGELVPERDRQELALAKQLINHTKLPVLGICRGAQLLNVACGGTLYQDISKQEQAHFAIQAPKYHTVHQINITPNSKLHQIFGDKTLAVNSYHHQAIQDVANACQVSAKAYDGIVEAIELEGSRFVMGVQWHPEMLVSHHRDQLKLFRAFVSACQVTK